MTYIDLLNYLINIQKIEKNDLAELLAIPEKKIDNVIYGNIPLKKKWLKNLSAFTSIPADSIRNGDFTLHFPEENEQTPSLESSSFASTNISPEIKEMNAERFKKFCKTRYKNNYDDIIFLPILLISVIVIDIFIMGYDFLIYYTDPANLYNGMVLFGCFIPILLLLFSINPLAKVAKSGKVSEEPNFKFYSAIPLLALVCFSISLVFYKIVPVWALIFVTLSILHPFYLIFISGIKKKYNKKITILGGILSLFLMIIFIFTMLNFSFVEKYANTIYYDFIVDFALYSWINAFLALGVSLVTYIYYKKTCDASKFFGQLPDKPVLKKRHKSKTIIALILVIAILSGAYFTCAPLIPTSTTEHLLYDSYWRNLTYSDYDKQNIVYSEDDSLFTVETEFYSIQLPDEFKPVGNSQTVKTYVSNDKKVIVSIQTEYADYGEALNKLFIAENDPDKQKFFDGLKQRIIDEFGFFPQSKFELDKICREINENDLDFRDNTLDKAVGTLIIFATTSELTTQIEFYEDLEKQLVIGSFTLETNANDSIMHYSIDGNKIGEYEAFVSINIMVKEDYSDPDIVNKIINSIEFK